jgi:glycosyltransferase involved in cell wall biosynthesis
VPPGIRVAICAPGELWGGVEQFVETVALHLQATGVHVVVVSLFDGPLRTKLDQSGIPVFVVGRGQRYDPRALTDMVALLRHHRINVVHTHGYKATILGAVAAKMAGARLVRTEHGRLEPSAGLEHLKMSFNQRLEATASRYGADAVVFVSRDVRQHSPASGGRAKQYVIYNGIDPIPDDVRHASLDGLDAGEDGFAVGVVGRIAPVKGHRHLLEAFTLLRHLPQAKLYVFGEGPCEAEHRAFVEANGLSGAVRFMGFRANVRAYLAKLDVLVMPSLHEGLPYALLEAMQCKVAVIASRVGGLAEVLEDEATGLLVASADPAALARAIERLYRDPTLRSSLAENAYVEVQKRFLAPSMVDRYLEVYRAVLEC